MGFIKHLLKRFKEDDYVGIPAQLAYFFLLSLFPLLIVLVSLFPYLPITQDDLLGTVRGFAPEGAIQLIEENLTGMMQKNGTLLSLGVIGTLWSASNGINSIVKVINRSYNIEEERAFFTKRLMAILLTLAMMVVIIVALILPVFGKQIGVFLFSQFQLSDEFLTIWNALRFFVSSVIIFVIFIGLYWLAPSKRFSCRTAFPGATFATIGWIMTSYAFSYYVDHFSNYSTTYGSIGAIIILMIWFYISGIIIIIGGDVNAYFTVYKKKDC